MGCIIYLKVVYSVEIVCCYLQKVGVKNKFFVFKSTNQTTVCSSDTIMTTKTLFNIFALTTERQLVSASFHFVILTI